MDASKKFCLICENQTEDATEILNTPYTTLFLHLSGLVKVQNSDNLCQSCLNELSECSKFQVKCLQSPHILTRKEILPTANCPASTNLKTEIYCDDDSTTFPNPTSPGKSTSPDGHSKQRDFMCTECGMNIFGLARSRAHQESHGAYPKSFECNICGIALRYKKNMIDHMLIHSGITPHRCTLCSQSFRTSSILARHLTFHENRRRFICPYCPLRFNLSSSRNFHVDSVHLKRPKYTCDLCSATFYHRRWFRIHLKTHNGGKDLPCTACDQKFYFKTDLRQHIRRKHTKDSEDGDTLLESDLGDTI